MAYTYAFAFQTGTASQTGFTAQLYDADGEVGDPIEDGFVDLGDGDYGLLADALPAGFQGWIKVFRDGTRAGFGGINPNDGEYVDTYISSRMATGGAVTYAGPVATAGLVSLVKGDDYDQDESRALNWTTTDASTWPTLTGATVTLTLRTGTKVLSKAGSVVTGTGASKHVRVELTNAETSTLQVGKGEFDLAAVLSNSRRVTLERGTLHVARDY